jgi:hypothetical protein
MSNPSFSLTQIAFSADGYHPSDAGYRYIFKRYDEEVLHPMMRARKLV